MLLSNLSAQIILSWLHFYEVQHYLHKQIQLLFVIDINRIILFNILTRNRCHFVYLYF